MLLGGHCVRQISRDLRTVECGIELATMFGLDIGLDVGLHVGSDVAANRVAISTVVTKINSSNIMFDRKGT